MHQLQLATASLAAYARSPRATGEGEVQSERTSHAYRSCMHRRGSNHKQGLLVHSKVYRVLSAYVIPVVKSASAVYSRLTQGCNFLGIA
jgi:hypothetical protein